MLPGAGEYNRRSTDHDRHASVLGSGDLQWRQLRLPDTSCSRAFKNQDPSKSRVYLSV